MGSERVTVSFRDRSGAAATGLTPTIDVWDTQAQTQVVTGASMTEVGGGSYVYDFTAYDPRRVYAFHADAGSTLGKLRYADGVSDSTLSQLAAHRLNRRRLNEANDREEVYDQDGTTLLFEYDLSDINGTPTVENITEVDPA